MGIYGLNYELESLNYMDLIPSMMVGIGLDNTNSMVGYEAGCGTIIKQEHAPFLEVNGCFGHLFNLSIKHSFDELRHLQEFDLLIKKVYKYFSKAPKKLLDLQKWYTLKGLKYHKLLNIFDIKWLSRANSVNNYRSCLVAMFNSLIEHGKDFLMEKKVENGGGGFDTPPLYFL